MVEKLQIDDIDVCVIFKKEYLQRNQRIIYTPFKVIKGNLEYQEYMFIDEEGNSYHHIYERYPGNGFAFRKSLLELENTYNTRDFNIIKENYLKEIDKYNYHFLLMYTEDNIETIKIIMENKETHETKEFIDKDYLEFIDPISLNEEENIFTSPQKKVGEEVKIESKPIEEKSLIKFNPHKLVSEIKKKVINQDEAIKSIVTTIWNNNVSEHIHNNILLIGPTGVGKTEILRNISKKLDIPFYQTSMASYSKTGYVGASVTSILDNLVKVCNGDINKAEHSIVFLDEIDKIAIKKDNTDAITGEDIQNELLKIMEDGIYTLNVDNIYSNNKEVIHTKDITFIGAGSFDGILETTQEKYIGFGNRNNYKLNNYKEVTNEHLIKYGFKPEFAGRMPITIVLNELGKEDLINIMKYSENNILSSYINMLNEQGITVNINEEVYELIADKAIKLKIGARGLNNEINRLFINAIYEISNPNNKYNYLEINADTVINPNNYILKYKSKRTRALKKH